MSTQIQWVRWSSHAAARLKDSKGSDIQLSKVESHRDGQKGSSGPSKAVTGGCSGPRLTWPLGSVLLEKDQHFCLPKPGETSPEFLLSCKACPARGRSALGSTLKGVTWLHHTWFQSTFYLRFYTASHH